MRVLGIDPSSTRTGYAVLDGGGAAGMGGTGIPRLVEGGYLTPKCQDDPAIQRIEQMGADLLDLVKEQELDAVVLEITCGKVGRRHKGGGAGLGVYGMAVGVIYGMLLALRAMTDPPVSGWGLCAVYENVWTGGVPKGRRQQGIAVMFPEYAAGFAKDPRADVADAIGVALWFMERDQFSGVSKRGKSRNVEIGGNL